MALPLPAMALAIEGDVVGTDPGHVHAQQLHPHLMPLGGTEFGVLVDHMLEVVHHGTVGDQIQALRQMAVAGLLSVRAEEELRPVVGKELHGHGVDLAGLHAGHHAHDPVQIPIKGKGVARLVGDDLGIVGSAVEISKDEGHHRGINASAVAAHGLAGTGLNIHHLPRHHAVPEFFGFGAQLGIEFGGRRQNVGGPALGLGIAGAEGQVLVGKAQGELEAHAPGLLHVDALAERHHIILHGDAELLHVLLGVAVALHPVVAQAGVAVVAQLAAHAVAQLHQLVVDVVQLLAVVAEPLALGHPGRPAELVIGAELEGCHLGQIPVLPLKGDLGGGDELGVLIHQLALPLQVLHQLGLEGAVGDLRVQQGHIAVLLLQPGPEGALKQGVGPLLGQIPALGQLPAVELDLGIVELVAGVHVVADLGHGPHGLQIHAVHLVILQHHLLKLLKACGIAQPLDQLLRLRFPRLQIHARILDLRKSHVGHPPW